MKQAFEAQRTMLLKATKAKKPTPAEFQDVCKETSELVAQIQACATTDRRATDFNHRQAISELIPAIGWVMVEKTPGPHVTDMYGCGMWAIANLECWGLDSFILHTIRDSGTWSF